MESSAAGQLANDTVIAENLRRLAALRPGVPVLSLYLDLDPSEFGTQPARASAYTSLLDEAAKHVEAHDTDHDGRRSLREAVERARSFLEDYRPEASHGIAIFAAPAADVFEAHSLPRAPRTNVVIDTSPAIAPMIAAIDTRDWLIVAVDARHARFLHGNTARVEELEHDRAHIPGQHERQSTSDHQRWVEHNIDQHLRDAAAVVDRLLATGRHDRLLIGGPAEIATRFEERILSNPARQKLAGRFDVEVPDTIPDDIRTAVAGCFEDGERRHEREVLDRLAERLGRGERAVAGIADVLAMLEQARVETLLYDDRAQTPPEALEQAVEDAVTQSAEVLPLRHHRDALREHGDVAAVLRF
jgi:peptide chain release factor subunit 1